MSYEIGGVKVTERGWAGHLIISDYCKFKRNTLLEYDDKKLIVSTVGCYVASNGKIDMIGCGRWYETMVFEAKKQNGYIEADTTKQICPEGEWGIWGRTWEEVIHERPCVDNDANDMHERIVEEMILKIKEGGLY